MNTAMIKRKTQLANNQIDLFCYYNYAEMLLNVARNDTSMFYQNGKRFVVSDFYTYYIFGKLTNKMINSAILKDFSFYITNFIKKLYDITICDENKKNLSQKFLKEKNEYNISIEFRDEKIDKIIKNSEFNKGITFESVLIIQEILFIEILLCYILDI